MDHILSNNQRLTLMGVKCEKWIFNYHEFTTMCLCCSCCQFIFIWLRLESQKLLIRLCFSCWFFTCRSDRCRCCCLPLYLCSSQALMLRAVSQKWARGSFQCTSPLMIANVLDWDGCSSWRWQRRWCISSCCSVLRGCTSIKWARSGAFMLVRLASGEAQAFDIRETAPCLLPRFVFYVLCWISFLNWLSFECKQTSCI